MLMQNERERNFSGEVEKKKKKDAKKKVQLK